MHMKGKIACVYLCKMNEWVVYIYIYVTHKRGTDRLFINIWTYQERDTDSLYTGMHIYERVDGIYIHTGEFQGGMDGQVISI